MTYSGTAAIHACLLVWIGPSYGELDFYALCAILSTSCLIAVPLINWSSTLRNLGSLDGGRQGARMIIIYWTFGITIACTTCLVRFYVPPYFVPYNRSIAETIACVPPTTTINYAAAQSPSWPTPSARFHIYTEWIIDNGCMDPCMQGPFLWPSAIFRSSFGLQTLSHKEYQNLFQYFVDNDFYDFYLDVASFMGFFVLAQGLWAMCFGRKTPRQCRIVIYNFVNNAKLPGSKSLQRHRSISRYGGRWQKTTAQYLAISAYLWAVVSSIICVILFVFNIFAMEFFLTIFPQSESARHVGAWTPWAATGLIVAAALISKIPSKPIRKTCNSFCQALKKVGSWIRSGVVTVRENLSRQEKIKQRDSVPTEPTTPGHVGAAKSGWLRAGLRTLKRKLASCGNTLRGEWKSLVGFWRDPDCTETATA